MVFSARHFWLLISLWSSSMLLLSQQMFPILHLWGWLLPHTDLCLSDLPPFSFSFFFFLFLFLPFQTVFPWSFSILTETSSNFIAVLPSLTSFVNSMSSVYAFSQIKTVRLTNTRTSTDHKVKLVITSLHFDNYPPNKFIESIYPFG